jgi:hypothetical protein
MRNRRLLLDDNVKLSGWDKNDDNRSNDEYHRRRPVSMLYAFVVGCACIFGLVGTILGIVALTSHLAGPAGPTGLAGPPGAAAGCNDFNNCTIDSGTIDSGCVNEAVDDYTPCDWDTGLCFMGHCRGTAVCECEDDNDVARTELTNIDVSCFDDTYPAITFDFLFHDIRSPVCTTALVTSGIFEVRINGLVVGSTNATNPLGTGLISGGGCTTDIGNLFTSYAALCNYSLGTHAGDSTTIETGAYIIFKYPDNGQTVTINHSTACGPVRTTEIELPACAGTTPAPPTPAPTSVTGGACCLAINRNETFTESVCVEHVPAGLTCMLLGAVSSHPNLTATVATFHDGDLCSDTPTCASATTAQEDDFGCCSIAGTQCTNDVNASDCTDIFAGTYSASGTCTPATGVCIIPTPAPTPVPTDGACCLTIGDDSYCLDAVETAMACTLHGITAGANTSTYLLGVLCSSTPTCPGATNPQNDAFDCCAVNLAVCSNDFDASDCLFNFAGAYTENATCVPETGMCSMDPTDAPTAMPTPSPTVAVPLGSCCVEGGGPDICIEHMSEPECVDLPMIHMATTTMWNGGSTCAVSCPYVVIPGECCSSIIGTSADTCTQNLATTPCSILSGTAFLGTTCTPATGLCT